MTGLSAIFSLNVAVINTTSPTSTDATEEPEMVYANEAVGGVTSF